MYCTVDVIIIFKLFVGAVRDDDEWAHRTTSNIYDPNGQIGKDNGNSQHQPYPA